MDPDDLTFDISDNLDKAMKNFPDEVAILPLRGVVVYPQTIVPLTIGQPRSIKLIDDVIANNKLVGLVASKNAELENPTVKEMYRTGTVGSIHRLFRAPDGTIRILVQGMARFITEEYTQIDPYFRARITYRPEIQESNLQVDALARNARDQFERIAEMIPTLPRELVSTVATYTDALQTVYTIANFQRMDLADAQAILEIDRVIAKLRRLVSILTRERDVLELGQKIQNEARSEMEKTQREYFLREQLKAIQEELGEGDEQTADIEEFRLKIDSAHMSDEASKQARRELDRLSRLPTAAAEYGVIRTYLDWMVSLPWSVTTPDNLDIAHARLVLEKDHYGLKDVKTRILEYLAVRKLRQDRKTEISRRKKDEIRKVREGVILCFIGPPGVGKTSLGQSIARAMNRKFIRISLGGVRDEAEIRGHRRTYIGAMPGRILQSMRRIESHNPVFMLDEIDKLRFDFSGDPASALLEVLDPEQNREFRDHYLEVAFDLSQVMFITTANSLETIPPPLLDRMEVIQIAGYTEEEKYHIARQYLVPRQLKENGLLDKEVKFSSKALHTIIRNYTQEAGVRNLERQIGSICRKLATAITEGKITRASVTPDYVRSELGAPLFKGSQEISMRTSIPGVATGLAWTAYGGDILFVEATRMPGSNGFMITGSIGNVMQESAKAGLSFIRSHAHELQIPDSIFTESDIHLHVPAGAQPKDGPSAGLTMITAMVSLFRQQPVRYDTGMTGEITLRGQVLPVGGIKEKILAAHRSGLKRVILPKRNKEDLDDLPESVIKTMEFILADNVLEVLDNALLPVKKAAKRIQKSSVTS
ncbi:MAG: endopeptidase La [Anaerolineaceae bacterium]|nr:endopeptidase La [Anaerolineaceae bacterium]